MRIARTAATLALVLAASACGDAITEPRSRRAGTPEQDKARMVSPESVVSLKSGNTIGSGS
jgi:hypothetical protein